MAYRHQPGPHTGEHMCDCVHVCVRSTCASFGRIRLIEVLQRAQVGVEGARIDELVMRTTFDHAPMLEYLCMRG